MVKPVVGIGSTVETEDGIATVIAIRATAIVTAIGSRYLIPNVVLRNKNGDIFEVAGSIFESMLS